MRDYGKVHTSFWSSDNIRNLSEDGRMLALYLLTCPHGTIAGVFRLPDGYICDDMQWTAKRVQVTLTELFTNGFATRCEVTKWVWVTKYLEWNPLENPNQRKAAAKLASQIPETCGWKRPYIQQYGALLGIETTPENTQTEPLPNGSPNPLPTLLPTLFESGTGTGTVTVEIPGGGPSRFDDFWGCWPKNDRKQDKKKCAEFWAHKKLDGVCDVILNDIKAKRKTEKWKQGYVEAPLVYLHNSRWEDAGMTVADDPVDWFSSAGFDTEGEARNFGCTPSTKHLFHEGKRLEVA